MAYEKRVCVLKQIGKGFSADGSALSGAVYAERMGTELTVTPRIPAIAPVREGRYALVLCAEGKTAVFELKGNESLTLSNGPSVKGGFAALVAFVKGEAQPVAYGVCGAVKASAEELLAVLNEKPQKERERKVPIPSPLPPNELPVPLSPNVPDAPGIPVPGSGDEPFRDRAAYDDEAIASSDYYRPSAGDADDAAYGGVAGEAGKDAHEDAGVEDLFRIPRGTLTYYHAVRGRIQAAFQKYPRDERLTAAFPRSEWVKSGGALLGIVYENGAPKYLCVAVEANGDPPEEMKERCCFVPAAPYSDDKGFYVVFQSADTGEYVTVSQA